jgi:hypothetical protein
MKYIIVIINDTDKSITFHKSNGIKKLYDLLKERLQKNYKQILKENEL